LEFKPYWLRKRMDQVEASIARYLAALETADRQEGELAQAKSGRLKDKIAQLREQMATFKALEPLVEAAPDQQLSLTDPDARSMATSGKGTGVVGYNVQTAVDAEHHLIVAHEVTNIGNDRAQPAKMAGEAKAAMGAEALEVLADRGYFEGDQVRACDAIGITPYLPKPMTSPAKAKGRYGKQAFVYVVEDDTYRCPAREALTYGAFGWRSGAACAGRPWRWRADWPWSCIACGSMRPTSAGATKPRPPPWPADRASAPDFREFCSGRPVSPRGRWKGEFATSAVSAVNQQRGRPKDSSTLPLIPSWGGSAPTSQRSTSLVRRHPSRAANIKEGRTCDHPSPLDRGRDREAAVPDGGNGSEVAIDFTPESRRYGNGRDGWIVAARQAALGRLAYSRYNSMR
jgi:hypothetical protein